MRRSKIHNIAIGIVLAASVLGFLDATYLTAKHIVGGIVPCAIGNCETVLTSSYATFFGIPIAAFGALFYLTIFILGVIHCDNEIQWMPIIMLGLGTAGFLASLWFIYLQIAVIGAICIYCMGSATTSTLIFIGTSWIAQNEKGRKL